MDARARRMRGDRWMVRLGAALLVAAVAAGCSEEIEGPTPVIGEAGATPAPVAPPIVCSAQRTTEVTLSGERFSPLPIDVPGDPKVALPDVVLTRSHAVDGADVSDPEEVLYSGDPDADTTNAFDAEGTPLVAWDSQQQMRFVINQDLELPGGDRGMLPEGVWDVRVENANEKMAESPQSLAVIDRPHFDSFSPGIVCLAQGDQSVTLGGSRFLRNGGDRVQLEVDGVEAPFAVELDACTAVAHAGIDAEVCDGATVAVAQDSIPVGFPALTLRNPETAACASEEDRKLRVVPPPVVDRAVPSLGCLAEGARTYVIEGAEFLRIDTVDPVVTVGGMDFAPSELGGCEPLETQGHEVERCTSVTIDIPQEALDPALYEVSVQNPAPAGCSGSAIGALRIVPPPAIEDVQPPLVCLDNGEREIVVTGQDFLTVDGELPSVMVDDVVIDPAAVMAADCAALEVPDLDVQVCTTLAVIVPEASVDIGPANVVVGNPQPAGCESARDDLLTVVPGPEITGAQPALLCTEDGARTIDIDGNNLMRIDGTPPAITVGGEVATVTQMTCDQAMMIGALAVEICSAVQVSVAQGALVEGRPEIMLENPGPAGCMAARSDLLTVPPALTLTELAPVNVCQFNADTAFALDVIGTGFLRVDGTDPAVTFGGNAVTPDGFTNCQTLEVADGSTVESCDTIGLTVDLSGGLTDNLGAIAVGVSNAHVAACPGAAMLDLNVVEPPRIDAIDIPGTDEDTQVCDGIALELVVTGANYVEGMIVTLSNANESLEADSVTVDSDTQITVTFAGGLPFDDDPGWDLMVDAGAGCLDMVTDAIIVNPNPLVFFVDPPVVYNDTAIDTTIFTSGLNANSSLALVEIVDSNDTATVLCDLDGEDVITPDCGNPRPNRIIANVPGAQTFAAGDYQVRVTSTIGCETELPGQLTVTDNLTAGLLTSIDPEFASPTQDTPVTIGGASIEAGARLYLTPVGVGNATALSAVEVSGDGAGVTAIVPGGLQPGVYDLLLVQTVEVDDGMGGTMPEDQVGLLENAVTVTVGEPPFISAVVPGSLPASAGNKTITLRGENFADPSEVLLECAGVVAPVMASSVTIDDPQTITAVVDVSGLSAGDVCLVRVTSLIEDAMMNLVPGPTFAFSALSITTSSLNLGAWSLAQDANMQIITMGEARRALSLEAGRPTSTSRYLYAMGGDTGAMNDAQAVGTVHDSVEAVPVDVFGGLGDWSPQRNSLPAPRTWAGSARAGRFLYVVGGHDGMQATDTVYRAQVLDPLAAPAIADVDAFKGGPNAGTGLSEGLYYYRVAAVFDANNPSNPGGESLPGEVQPVQLPMVDDGIILSLTLTEVPGAVGYRVYRATTAGVAPELLTEVSCVDVGCDCNTVVDGALPNCPVRDDADGTTMAGVTPLPAGSLGVWHDVGQSLDTAREAHASAAIEDPAAPGTYYLYAFGGRGGNGVALDSYEVATITDQPDGSQALTAFVPSPGALAEARAELGIFVMNADNSSYITDPDTTYIFVGPGRVSGNTFSTNVSMGTVGAAGDLGDMGGMTVPLPSIATNREPGDMAGYGYGQANNQLFVFGGFGGVATDNGRSKSLCDPNGCTLPDVEMGAWNPLGAGVTEEARIYSGSTQESAFFFMCGGHDGTMTLSTTEQTVQ